MDTPPIGIVVAVRPWTMLENVRYTVARIREQRAQNGPFESLFTGDLRALLASRHRGGAVMADIPEGQHPLTADECLHTYKSGDDTEVSCPLPVVFTTTNQCPIHGEEIIALCGLHLMDDFPTLLRFLL